MNVRSRILHCGIDIGSTTAKVVLLDKNNHSHERPVPLFSFYQRHDARIRETLRTVFEKLIEKYGDIPLRAGITGSAGIGISERLGIPFVQEVIAAAEVIQRFYPNVRTLLDIGGEDSKLIFFDDQGRTDIRMNGSCAGGTGAFIDQMASLLDIPIQDLNKLAKQHKNIYPIASRCGVFAKTDLQNLLSRGISKSDIAASVFNAVALQTINTLSRGYRAKEKVLFSGGPLTFIPFLHSITLKKLGLSKSNIINPPDSELLSAIGVAISSETADYNIKLSELASAIAEDHPDNSILMDRDKPLFRDKTDYDEWSKKRFTPIKGIDVRDLDKKDSIIGIDCGSTTTKMILMDSNGSIALEFYTFNRGDHISAVKEGFKYFYSSIRKEKISPFIIGAAVTGYGEDLIKAAFDLDFGVVETIAHYRAARHLVPNVSFVLDIGGQDMKAMFIENETVKNIEINEACSSGCGSFLQTFSETLGVSLSQFSEKACRAGSPCNLGSRCTVFMNSRVKQFLREGSKLEDIMAGLAYSVIRNCLNKVLKIKDMDVLGDVIVVQGGTFLNPAIQRTFELLTQKEVICPDMAGLTGAYGCALVAMDQLKKDNSDVKKHIDLKNLASVGEYSKKELQCKGCTNICRVTRMQFINGRKFYTGNRCERVFSNRGEERIKGENLAEFREQLLFDRPYSLRNDSKMAIGIPRVLNLYENLPFWNTLFINLGFRVVLSNPSSSHISEKGTGTVMSDSICFPAKLAHGHIIDLIDQGVDRIFYPIVVQEQDNYDSFNSFNCPIVTGYPDVIRSSIDPEDKYGIPFDTPVISFKDLKILKKACWKFLKPLDIKHSYFISSFEKALQEQSEFLRLQHEKLSELENKTKINGNKVVLLLGRPYHLDRLINHGIPDILTDMGMDVITSCFIPDQKELYDLQVLTQWAYPNRLYNAAKYAVKHENIEVIQINSFGCGPDALASDEVSDILNEAGKGLTLIRVDESASPGSIRLRLRTLIETLNIRKMPGETKAKPRISPPPFKDIDRKRKILFPNFSPILAPIIESEFSNLGYNVEVLPPSDHESEAFGLKFVHNEVCYPAILVIGDILRALSSGDYDLKNIAIGISQTGGQCRASSYISLLNKALISAGYYDIPVVTVYLTSKELHYQPGFRFDRQKLMKSGFYSIIVADALAMMQRSLAVREIEKGASLKLAEKYVEEWLSDIERSSDRALSLLEKAVNEFSSIPVRVGEYPRIGIVGEIYVKYGAFSNKNVVDWLTEKGVQAVIPQLASFFLQEIVNVQYDTKAGIRSKDLGWLFSYYLESKTNKFLQKVNELLYSFPYSTPFPRPRDLGAKASEVIGLTNQYGEGWLIAAEMMELADQGINNILCLQPFGCIANQVVAKGVEKKLKEVHPELNILFADLDHNTSGANLFNRIHFLVKNASLALEKTKTPNSSVLDDVLPAKIHGSDHSLHSNHHDNNPNRQ